MTEDIDDYIARIDNILSRPTTSSNASSKENSNSLSKNTSNRNKSNRLFFSDGYNTFEQIESLVKRALTLHKEGVYIPPPKTHTCKRKRKGNSKKSDKLEGQLKAPEKKFGSGRIGVSCNMYGFKKCTCCAPNEEDVLLRNFMNNQPEYNMDDEHQLYIDLTKPNTLITQRPNIMDNSIISISDSSPYNSSDEVVTLDDTEVERNSSLIAKIENIEETSNSKDSVTDYINQVYQDYDEDAMRKYEEELSADIENLETNLPVIKTEINDSDTIAPNYAHVENITDYIDLVTTDSDKELIETLHNEILDILPLVTTPIKDNTPNKQSNGKENSSSLSNSYAQLICPVCLDELKGKEIMSTVCGHLFCSECIKEAIKKTKACPNCRNKLTLKRIHPIYLG